MQQEYTDEQRADIEGRVKEAKKALDALQLNVACYPTLELVNGMYGVKLYPFLQDAKYTSVPSPLTP